MNSIALIGNYNNICLKYYLETLMKKRITISYLIIFDSDKFELANTVYAIDNNFSFKDIKKIEFNPLSCGVKKICQENSIPYFCVANPNSFTISRILNQYPIDVLFVNDESIINRDAIYIPCLFALNCHVDFLSYIENSTTYLSEISLRVIQPDSSQGPIVGKRIYNIGKGNNLEDINKNTEIVCIDLATDVLNNIQNNKIPPLQYQNE